MALPLPGRIEKMTRHVNRFGEMVGHAVSYLILAIIFITVYEVIMRYGFNRPTIWVHESSEMIFAVMFLIGGAYALLHDGHVRVDVFYGRLSRRTRLILDTFTSLFFFGYLGMLTWKGGGLAIAAIQNLERSQTPWAPYIFPVIALMPIASFLMMLLGASKLIAEILSYCLRKPDEH
jgi:TRAP-type mannitol/chloroaromatic compound transport system permease small subunit